MLSLLETLWQIQQPLYSLPLWQRLCWSAFQYTLYAHLSGVCKSTNSEKRSTYEVRRADKEPIIIRRSIFWIDQLLLASPNIYWIISIKVAHTEEFATPGMDLSHESQSGWAWRWSRYPDQPTPTAPSPMTWGVMSNFHQIHFHRLWIDSIAF